MPVYRFHIFNDDHTLDGVGKDLPDLAAARAVAIMGARDIMATEIRTRGQIDLNHRIEIEDPEGVVTVVTFADAVRVSA